MNAQAVEDLESCCESSSCRLEQKLVSLDKDGDAIFEIDNTDSSDTIKFLVSTNVLRLASPVFAKMFGPTFIEGQQLRSEGRACVKLEDDNAYAMKTILEILHHRPTANINSINNAKELACLAAHCDKYDCRAALRPWTYFWFSDLERVQTSPMELIYLLLAAYDFGEPKHFASISVMVEKHLPLTTLKSWYDHEVLNLLPEIVADALKSKIQGVLNDIHMQVQSVITVLGREKKGYEMTLQDALLFLGRQAQTFWAPSSTTRILK